MSRKSVLLVQRMSQWIP